MTVSDRVTNQVLLDALFLVAQENDANRFDLIERASLWPLFYDRESPYTGPPVVGLPGLTDDEKKSIQRKLIESLARRQNPVAVTLGHLNLRTGPGVHFAAVQTLPPDTTLNLLDDMGDWVKVQVQERQGYVHRDYITLTHQPVKNRLLAVQPELLRIPLPPLPAHALDTGGLAAGTLAFALAQLWNRYGGMLAVLANELEIHASVAVAVLLAESGGQGFQPGPSGPRMVIRFENHIFHDRWGRANQERFDRHFVYTPGRPWLGHRFRADGNGAWQEFHGEQQREWDVFAFAEGLDRRAARESISMGLPQIMGFNALAVGYPQAEAMFDAFASGEARQIFGFFDFVRSKGAISALRSRDYGGFASIYNGPGQATLYAGIIQERVDLFEKLWQTAHSRSRGITPPVGEAPAGLPLTARDEEGIALRRQLAGLLADQRRTLWLHQALLVVALVVILAGVGLLIGQSLTAGLVALLVGAGALALWFLRDSARLKSTFQEQFEQVQRLLDAAERLP